METARGDGSASFDRARYHHEIVRPLRTNLRRLPQDLRVRYDVHGPRSDQALARHLDEVIGYWSERSREQPDYSRAVYVALLKAHQQLVTDPTVRLHSATWWSTYQPPEPDAAAEPSSQPLSDADTYTAQHCSPQRLEQPSVDVTAEADAAIEPLDGAVAAATTGVTGPASTVNALITDLPTAEGQMIDGAVADRVHGLTASRIGDDIELSWVWPSWATTAIVSWDDGIHKLVDREEFRRTGRWRTTLSPALSDGRVEFSVAVRGADPNRREWSKVARVVAPEPCQEVEYEVRRLWYRFPSRAYKISFRASRASVLCNIIICFARSDALPENVETCERIGTVFLATDMTTQQVTVPRRRGRGWLRCFLVNGGSITLKDPDVSTLEIRSWLR